MRPPRVYVDTSVIGGCQDVEFAEESQALIEMARQGRAILVVSDLLLEELQRAPRSVRQVLDNLPPASITLVHGSPESRALRDAYLAAGIVGPASDNDAHHVALATVGRADMIVSWNFKHIVHYDKIRQYNAVNRFQGHREIEIYSPPEVVP